MNETPRAETPRSETPRNETPRSETPRISVVITAYNQKDLVGQAVGSVLAQTHENVEILVVDDGSSDDTGRYLLHRFGRAVRYFRQENRGQGAARNLGLCAATGDYVQFLDGDDLLLPTKLTRQLEALARSPGYHAAYCDYAFFVDAPEQRRPGEHRERYRSGNLWPDLLRGNFLLSHTPLVALDVVRCVGGFDEDRRLSGCEDYDLWLRLAWRGCRFAYVDEVLALYRRSETGFTADHAEQQRRTLRVLRKIPRYAPRLTTDERATMAWYSSRLELFLGLGELRKHHPGRALLHLARAVRRDFKIVRAARRHFEKRTSRAASVPMSMRH